MGPLCNDNVLRQVVSHVDDARSKGAEVIQATDVVGRLYPPTILVNVTDEMLIAREETFGPVAPIIKFQNVEAATNDANVQRRISSQ